jgi:RimJ/RimL family protein N-acetyltransferase
MDLHYPNPPLTDGDVSLRSWRLPDDYATLENASSDLRITVSTSLPAHLTEEGADAWVARQHRRVSEGSGISLAITTAHSDQSVGLAGIYGLQRNWGIGDLGYWVAPAVRGQGAAQAGVRLLVQWAWEVLDLTRIEARIVPDNVSSIRVAEAAGLTREGLHPARYHKGGVWFDLLTYGAVNPLRPIPATTWTDFELDGGDTSQRA